ncbi:MAG: serine/threonine-protein kinase [Actinomycetota bacterium]
MTQVSIDRYSDFSLIAEGASSAVYSAYQGPLDRLVAVKVLYATGGRQVNLERFFAEMRALGQVSEHPNIVTIYDSGVTNEGHPFISMELLEGSLAERIQRTAFVRLPADEVLDLALRMLGALESAHSNGIIHRDVGPENILFSHYGSPVLIDFGIASVPGSGAAVGGRASMHYASPEVLAEAMHGPQSDLYSLGATLYTALAGHPPFAAPGRDTAEELKLRLAGEPPRPIGRSDSPTELELEVLRMLSNDPARRPSATQALASLRRLHHDSRPPGSRSEPIGVDHGAFELRYPSNALGRGTSPRAGTARAGLGEPTSPTPVSRSRRASIVTHSSEAMALAAALLLLLAAILSLVIVGGSAGVVGSVVALGVSAAIPVALQLSAKRVE